MLITLDDFAAYLQVADVDTVNASTFLLLSGLVEGLIVAEIGAVDDPTPSGVLAVALEATARAYRNPEGFTSETIDDYTYRRDATVPGVYLTGAEIRRLHVGIGETPARSVQLTPSWRVATD